MTNSAYRLVDLVLKNIEVVGGGHSDDVFTGVPSCVKDLLTEVQAVHADLVFAPFAANTNLSWLEDGSGFAVLPRGFQCHVTLCVSIKHTEEVVVGACHQDTVSSIPDTFKLVKDAIVLVQRA